METSHHKHSDECQVTAFQRMALEAEITLTPKVECGPLNVTCLKARIQPTGRHHHRGKHGEKCRITVFQELEVEIPVTFEVDAECKLSKVVCFPPTGGHCDLDDSSDSRSDSRSDSSSDSSSDSDSSSESDSVSDRWVRDGKRSVHFWYDDESDESDESGSGS